MCPTTLILWAIATTGLTSIVVDSKAIEPFREAMKTRFPATVGYLVSCYQCAGLYCGVACGALAIAGNDRASIVLMAFAGSAVAQVFAAGMNRLQGVQA